jgi:hypothetical protein
VEINITKASHSSMSFVTVLVDEQKENTRKKRKRQTMIYKAQETNN